MDNIKQRKVFLLEVLSCDSDYILQHVQQAKIITNREYNNIKSSPNNNEKKMIDLLDLIIFKGNESCLDFLQLLDKEDIKDTFPKLRKSAQPVGNISVFAGRPTQETQQEINQGDEYKMSSQPRGYCLIFNNSNFLQLKPRSGTHKDAEALDKVFTWLGFEVNTFHDLKADEMHARLKEYGEMSHEGKDCLVCCVLSHGELQCVFGTDDQKVTIKEIISFFDGRNCPSLLQKPKVFFIQACQGEKMQEAVRVQADGGDVHPGLEADLKCHNMIPINADVLLGMATVQECLSLRHTETGSWYIQSLCMQLKESCPRKEDIHTILTKVNEEVSKKSAFLKKQLAKQIPEPRYTLTKKLIFHVPEHSRP
ncbi:caspase-8 [Amia ocellicauda]|uniref:caspase-8 n=1 Tax=Amia ocellicauda TaxID=2972642 RepID=UPI0034649BD9